MWVLEGGPRTDETASCCTIVRMHRAPVFHFAVVLTLLGTPTVAPAAQRTQASEPQLNQPGKDVQWVPTPPALVEKMLDLAHVTAQDRVVDLGSGDGVL